MHPSFTPNFWCGLFKSFSISVTKCLLPICFQLSANLTRTMLTRQLNRGLSAVEDMFMHETLQFEAELEAEGLPPHLSPLEAAMALVAQEEVRPLHKLSLVRISLYLSLDFAEIHLLAVLLAEFSY